MRNQSRPHYRKKRRETKEKGNEREGKRKRRETKKRKRRETKEKGNEREGKRKRRETKEKGNEREGKRKRRGKKKGDRVMEKYKTRKIHSRYDHHARKKCADQDLECESPSLTVLKFGVESSTKIVRVEGVMEDNSRGISNVD
jgi:hypothetical protein